MNVDQDDVKELIANIKAEKQAQKDKELRDSWTKYVSLTLVCLAVLTAIATLKGASPTTTRRSRWRRSWVAARSGG